MSSPDGSPRIALFIGGLSGGGAERVTVTLANELAHLGQSVDLVVANGEGPYRDEISPLVRLIDLGVSRGIYALFPLVLYLYRTRPKAIISSLPVPNILASLARFASPSTKLLLTEHNTVSVDLKGTLKHKILRVAMAKSYRLADEIVAVSDGVARDMEAALGLPPQTVKTIYNPVISATLLQRSYEPVEWEDDDPLIVAAGRLVPQKDYPTLLHAFAHVRQHRRAKLVILGEGELRTSLQRMANELGVAEDVWLAGFVANPYPWMRRADLFVLSSSWEGLPTVLLEAMACGTRVVSTDCPSGPREILQDGRWGRLTPVGDPNSLARAMLETLDSQMPPDCGAWLQNFTAAAAGQFYLELLEIGTSPRLNGQ
ncbi:glycosyltransferase [Pelagibacterium sp.]|uniref:glycosyltransferase n=1 Tax=Pelagibacterium sp. TaxID=1967288 RepID=UPI003BAC514E